MTWSVVVREAAQTDIAAAVAWYESEAPDEVARFSREFDSTIERIAAHPLVPTPFVQEFRRMVLRAFPYQVWYAVDADREVIEVVAVVHHRQEPKRFEERE